MLARKIVGVVLNAALTGLRVAGMTEREARGFLFAAATTFGPGLFPVKTPRPSLSRRADRFVHESARLVSAVIDRRAGR